ncbi:MAG: tRNA uracil 4-sulfurtransferase ThiI [bacterium]
MNLIIHPDELFLKGANQKFFYDQLVENLLDLFKGIKIKRVEGGLWVENFVKNELKRLAFIPGIANFSQAWKCKDDIDSITKLFGLSLRDKIGNNKIKTFRITANRNYKKYALTSLQIAEKLGEHVRKEFNLKVDLKNHELNIFVTINKEQAIVYANPITGIGGLPTGTSGKVLCLVSGGIDSPVSAYKMMGRGAQVGIIHFLNKTGVSQAISEKIIDLCKTLSQYQPQVQLFVVGFKEMQRQVVMKIPGDHRMLATRRLFFKISEKIAKENRYQALATGDSLGQVASQTIENMNVIYQATDMLKFSPLIALNKREIIKIAKDIGTLEISQRPYEDCCSLFVAKHPQTKAKLDQVLKMEAEMDLSTLDNLDIKSYDISMNTALA